MFYKNESQLAIIIIMNNLQSLKSELLLEYSEKELEEWRRKNFYEHHNLPARTIVKTREGTTSLNARSNTLRLTNSKFTSQIQRQTMREIVGRKLFENQSRQRVPGPGSYHQELARHPSHCYIKKEEEFIKGKIAKKLRRRQLINQCRGPGIYNTEQAYNYSSKSKSSVQGKMSQSFFTRCILPQAKKEGLYLASTLSERFIRNNEVPSPSKYDTTLVSHSLSNMNRPIAHLMSTTQRSSIIKPNTAPGPGSYNWEKYFQHQTSKKPSKGKIQYKFVYGYPS